GDVHHVHAIEAASVPRIKRIMRTHRKPSDGAKAEAGAVSKADEEDKRRRPNRTIAYKHRARPPAPVVLIVEPAAIVIRRPAPGLVGNPSPAVIRFPHPPSRLIRGPGSLLIRRPDVAIARDIYPVAIGVKVVYAGVVTIGVSPAMRVANHVVA